MKINIIIDNKKSWFYKKAGDLVEHIKKLGHSCKIYSSQSKILKGSDITFFLSCEKYITKSIRAKSKFNIVIHASDLPKGKGMSPTTWQILENKKKIPVTLFEVADKLDSGDYYLKSNFNLNGIELIDEWQEKLYQCIKNMALTFVQKDLKPKKQKGKPSNYRRRTPKDSELNINKSIKSQFNVLRIVNNKQYPAFFIYKGNKYIIKIYKDKN